MQLIDMYVYLDVVQAHGISNMSFSESQKSC